jgi:hypothetical protein
LPSLKRLQEVHHFITEAYNTKPNPITITAIISFNLVVISGQEP